MSELDQYRLSPEEKAIANKTFANELDQYRLSKEEKGDSWPALVGKSALKGFSSIADIPKVSGQLLEGMVAAQSDIRREEDKAYGKKRVRHPYKNIKPYLPNEEDVTPTNYSEYIPSSEDVRSGIKKYTGVDLEPHPSSPAQRIAARGAEFAGSMTPWGLAGKGANLLNKFNKAGKLTKTGAGVGLTSGVLQETGIDPLTADLAGSVIAPNVNLKTIADKAKYVPAKGAMKLMGLGPNRINVDTAKAARDLGIDLPASVLTDSTLTSLADQAVSKTPFFGNFLKDKYNKVQDKTLRNLEKIYNETGPLRTEELEKRINNKYIKSEQSLPKGASIKPENTIKAIKDLKIDLSDVPTSDELKVQKLVNNLRDKYQPVLRTQYGDVTLPMQDALIERLSASKRSLNKIIKWDIPGETINQLANIQKAIKKDIEIYGQTNPKWYKNYKEADELYGRMAKREKVEKSLRNEGTMGDPEELSYSNLSRSINNRKNLKVIKKQMEPETFENLKKLGQVVKAMVQKNRRVPNPSGTAATATVLSYLVGLYVDPTATLSNTGIGAIMGAAGMSRLLTDKKFINLAVRFAEEKGTAKTLDAMALNKRAKEITGYSLNSIYQNLNKEMSQ